MKEIDKMEGELNDIQASIEKLKEENATFKENVKKLTEENTNLGKSLEAEKHKSTKYENMYESLKEEVHNQLIKYWRIHHLTLSCLLPFIVQSFYRAMRSNPELKRYPRKAINGKKEHEHLNRKFGNNDWKWKAKKLKYEISS